MAKIGRNDLCACGSGKKYKRCCYAEDAQRASEAAASRNEANWSRGSRKAGAPLRREDDEWSDEAVRKRLEAAYGDDDDWRKIRRTEGKMVHKIVDYVLTRYGSELLQEAMGEFDFHGGYPIENMFSETIVIPWSVFNWIPPKLKKGRSSRGRPKQQLGLEYLKENAGLLDEYERAFIFEACHQPFSFFVITDVAPGKSLGLRDLFLDRTFTVKEASASRRARPGDILFTRVVPMGEQAVMVGMAPVPLPPGEHLSLLDLRDSFKKHFRDNGLELNQFALFYLDVYLREAYLIKVEQLTNPPRPQMVNTDGDPLTLAKVYFKLECSALEALEGLISLAHPAVQDALLEQAVNAGEGGLPELCLEWVKKGNKAHKHWDNTLLGRLTIKGNILTAEVNSEKRAKKIQSEIKKRLGANAVFQKADYESIEDKVEELANQPDGPLSEAARKEKDGLDSRPEIQAMIKAELEAHWEGWYTKRLPALGNKTPLAAARTTAGRERLEALLVEFERKNETVLQPLLRLDIEAMRKRLGL